MKTQATHSTKNQDQKILFLTGVLISFLGWAWETFYAAVILQSPNDRGFLILPFCPIYGFSVIIIYLLFRTPKEMSIFGNDIGKQSAFLRYPLYFFLSSLFATVFELITGFFFDRFFQIRLWNYQDFFGNIGGYVAFYPSIAWGIAITVFMRLVFHPLYHLVQRYTQKTLHFLFWFLLFLLLIDTAFNFSYLMINGKWFNFNQWI